MPQIAYDVLPLSSIGSRDLCKAEAVAIHGAVMRMDTIPRRVGCTIDMMVSKEMADAELIPYEWFIIHTKDVFPCLCVQVRFDHTAIEEELIRNIFTTFNCEILSRDICQAPFFR